MWIGGFVPVGYNVRDRHIVVDEGEAEVVRYIFRRYQELGCVRLLKEDLDRRGVLSKRRISKNGVESGGCAFSRGALYALLSNPIYVGEIRHKKISHPVQHEPILERTVWEQTQQKLREHRVRIRTGGLSVERSPLTGRVIDENGDRLTPSHTRRGERKYRYYVSPSSPAQGSKPARMGWRLPARELEGRVAAAIREMLSDEASVLEAAQKTDLDPRQIDLVLHAARAWRQRLQAEAEQAVVLATLTDRVILRSSGLDVSIKLPLVDTEEHGVRPSGVALTRSFPMQIKRRGVERRLIVGDHDRSEEIVDLALLKAVARAHRWFDELSTGRARSLAQIAAHERLNVRYVGRLIRLAFLAPDIVESIIQGRQPAALTAEGLATSRSRSSGARRRLH